MKQREQTFTNHEFWINKLPRTKWLVDVWDELLELMIQDLGISGNSQENRTNVSEQEPKST